MLHKRFTAGLHPGPRGSFSGSSRPMAGSTWGKERGWERSGIGMSVNVPWRVAVYVNAVICRRHFRMMCLLTTTPQNITHCHVCTTAPTVLHELLTKILWDVWFGKIILTIENRSLGSQVLHMWSSISWNISYCCCCTTEKSHFEKQQVSAKPSTAAVNNATLLAFAADRRAAAASLSIDISCPRGAQQRTRRTRLQRSIDGTDIRTDTRPLNRPCFAVRIHVLCQHWR